MADIRYALRSLKRAPMLTAVVVLSLGLGIGANTAMFSLLYQVVLRSLPVRNPEELVILKSPEEFKSGRKSSNDSGGPEYIFSYPMFRGLERHRDAIAGMAGFCLFGANIAYGKQTVDGSVMTVSGGYFPLLGVTPLLGRLLTPEDDVHGAGRPVAVLSHAYWQNRLGGQRDILNQTVRVNGEVFTIVGVAQKGFTGTTLGDAPDVFVPLALKPRMTPGQDGTDRWDDYWIYVFARLAPGVSRERAQAALNTTYRGLVDEQASTVGQNLSSDPRFRSSKLSLIEGRQGQSENRGQMRIALWILLSSTFLVLLIAIANTANLLLARAAQRTRELAIRTALGAGKATIVRQVLTESMLLSAGGGIAGLFFASWTVQLLLAMIGSDRPTEELTGELSWPVLLFAVSISLSTGLLCGLYPAWESARRSVSDVLREQAANASASLGTARLRKILVAGQVTISTLLLVVTGLFLKSLVNLMSVDLGVNTENVITFSISPSLNSYKPAQTRALFERSEEALAGIPGVRSVTAASIAMLAGNNWGHGLTVEGYSRDEKADRHSMFNMVSAGYFTNLGIPLMVGREFSERDTLGGPKVAVVNERFAKHFFGDRNPIGRKIAPRFGNVTPDIEIVGVVKDSHYAGVKQTPPKVYYTPWRQSEDIGSIAFYLRTALPPERLFPQIRQTMSSIDPNLPLEDLRTLEEQVRLNIRSDRVVLQLSSAFAVLATVLAMLGLYGVLSYSVARRTREIGIRIALGAPSGRIQGMVFREVLLILAGGLATGLPAAAALAKFTESQLFGVKSFDAAVIAGSAGALIAAAVLAGYLPARRAAHIQPVEALRQE